ncbi:hypothetical protein [Planctomicrobium piriforme]|uniref:Lipoprotein n=1 Tax=Planctomicrobium piriforme TaxID=1576369 RepID=A0A1I3SMD8_9PLAN|nr:hypothetical protein [Planctomicrobium piriforme]SFJ58596.1 hypothetical protein SAMN05421753_12449 [Planctomicrobium piriforme]
MTLRVLSLISFLTILTGCIPHTIFQAKEGSESAARSHFSSEMQKWMAGQDNDAATMSSRINSTLPPISFNVRSVVPDKPDPLAFAPGQTLPENWRLWPAYRFNVAIEFKSQAGTPLEKISTYTLTWNDNEKRWYLTERTL